ncbi:MAG TPA: S53 family peptidase [Ktedonobacterales bacterium]|nr:S53 family peptidase [Ktedonobacterales bacterium]
MARPFARKTVYRFTSIIAVALVTALVATAFVHSTLARADSTVSPEPVPANIDGAPTIADLQFLSASTTPPAESACHAVNRRCFNPAAMAGSYNYAGLHASGINGNGITIAIVDSFGSSTIANDLNVFDTAFDLHHLCGEANYTCQAGDPTFSILNVQGNPPPTPPPPNNGTGQENHNLWSIEVSLDVEWAHATAPMANILLVTTPTAETLGVQGFQQMMNAEQYVVDNHLADVITQSFGAGEGTFGSQASLLNLRHAFVDAQANHVTVLASSGDGGTTNSLKVPVKNPGVIPYPSIIWPASDPLVTAVGGTYLCTDTTTGTTVDSTSPPSNCQHNPGQREVGWIAGGGGYSIYFPRPGFQDVLPPGSTFVGSSAGAPGPNTNMRGIPDISYQASARTGVLVYDTEPGTKDGSAGCGGSNPCDTGWYVVGGTSSGSPQWAGLVALADQIAHNQGHGDVGYINPALYQIASNPAQYAADFNDVTVGNNQTSSIPGYSASPGWDAVTGLGTPNAALLLPDLVAAAS